MIVFGPVPSRRLGRSLGINNIPPKHCTYTCIHCQVGRTTNMAIDRRSFYKPELLLSRVREHLEWVYEPVDYLTFVPDGEPTLDENLDRAHSLLRTLELPIAVISNVSLIWRQDVREDLAMADGVSLKVDAAQEPIWRQINRSNRKPDLSSILAAMLDFAETYRGALVTETMLVEGVNDGEDQVGRVADFLHQLRPTKANLLIPTRPPAEKGVPSVKEAVRNARAYSHGHENEERKGES